LFRLIFRQFFGESIFKIITLTPAVSFSADNSLEPEFVACKFFLSDWPESSSLQDKMFRINATFPKKEESI
jgi:hypothetical protein